MKIIQVLLMFCFTLLTISGSAQTYTPTESFIEIDGLAAMQISTAEEERGIVSKNKVKLNVQALLNGSSVRGVVDSRELVTDPDAGKGFDMQLPVLTS